MSDVSVGRASVDEAREIARRRGLDDTAIRLTLAPAERGTAWVARDEAEVVGIAVAHDSEDERYVGDLFVEPSFRGQGLGSQLVSAAFADAGDRRRTMLVDPADAAMLALALRNGLALREPVLRVAGAIPKEEELARMAAGDYRFAVEMIDPDAHGFGLRELDQRTRGVVRDDDHREFALRASGYAFALNGELVAYAYAWPDGRIGPVASSSPAYLVQIFAFVLRALSQRFGASWCTALVPGSNLRVSRVALKAGLRIAEGFVFATDPVNDDTSRYVGYHHLLF